MAAGLDNSVEASVSSEASAAAWLSGTALGGIRRAAGLFGLVLVIACLHWARAVAIPVSLALLLSLLLTPVVIRLQRRGLGRIPSVLVTVLLAGALLGAVGWAVTGQLAALIDELPRYRENIRARVDFVREAHRGTFVGRAEEAARDMAQQIAQPAPGERPAARPVLVKLEAPGFTTQLPSLLEAAATAGLVVALVIFMLIRRDELRARLIRVIGYSRLTLTVRALEEAASRISRYLVAQCLLNASFGLAVGLGLFAVGLPYAIFWGFLGALLRFVPYAGTFIAMVLPTALALAVFDGWTRPLLVAALFLIVEPLVYFVLEPILYGQSIGVSEVALLVALAFWTWLWGPVGLILAAPLTVCLVVTAKYVRELEFIEVLMTDGTDFDPAATYYHRLLAAEPDEAARVVADYRRDHPVERLFEAVLVPALAIARRDRARDHLSDEDVASIVRSTQVTLEKVCDAGGALPAAAHGPPVALMPVRDDLDLVALEMLGRLLEARGIAAVRAAWPCPAADVGGHGQSPRPRVVCLGAVTPGGIAEARHICRGLRARTPDLAIVVWLPGDGDETYASLLREAGASRTSASLLEVRDHLLRYAAGPEGDRRRGPVRLHAARTSLI